MNYKQVIGILSLTLIMGCVATKPSFVENGLYINPKYQFSLQVPEGWTVSNEIPESFSKKMSILDRYKFKATFSDLNNKRFIVIAAEKTDAGWTSFKMYSDRFISSLDGFYARDKKRFSSKPGWKYYNYSIFNDNIEECSNACIASEILMQCQDLKAIANSIIYKGSYGKLYSVSIVLVSRESKYDSGLVHFKKTVDSFEMR
ncbi:uncharacterized protein Dvar_81580 [Desulfosarcina variabilis str. Montpellier]|uniref:hypothetical protein n=1 Tax=Desulfosarcina variabilis TaxID=2300 RepID=UPI003AFACE33